MKKMIIMVTLLFLTLLVIPINVSAKEQTYNTLNFKEALADEEIELKANDYEENDDQITIYLFRGKGCGYCRAYLEYMSSISEEYGKYFKMVSYEVWNDSANSKLMKTVANFLDEEASGVPFIVIGDQVFTGYSESYNEKIQKAITDLYNKDKSERYDVFEEMSKASDTTNNNGVSSVSVIIWNLVFIITAVSIILVFTNKKFNKLNDDMEALKKSMKQIAPKQNSKSPKKDSK